MIKQSKMKAVFSVVSGTLFAAGTLLCSCDDWNMGSINEATFGLPDESNTPYLLSKRYFLLVPGDTAFLYGTEACTVITNGVVTSVRSDAVYFRTITQKQETLSINGERHVVIPQLFQQSNEAASLAAASIVRYFEQDPHGVKQVAYSQGNDLCRLDSTRQTIMPNPLEIGSLGSVNSPRNNWAASPLIPCPIGDVSGSVLFEGRSVASEVLALPAFGEPYVVRLYRYWDGMELKTYYTLNATHVAEGEHVFIMGTIIVTSTYFADRGLVDQSQEWRIHRCRADGGREMLKKSVYLARGPEGARLYPDFDTTAVQNDR
ncbi:MAG: hypothetical protein JW768_14000 [Chitinispirillaceae bacterium]|nr:hypothetical protein [Chitinispirillaceae bacterium]